MELIDIKQLHPGESAVATECVAKHRGTVRASSNIEPVSVCELGGRLSVRNGNNRVRALVEEHGSASRALLVPCVRCDPPSTSIACEMLRRQARYYGAGADAFTAMPIVDRADYERVQGEQGRIIWRAGEKII